MATNIDITTERPRLTQQRTPKRYTVTAYNLNKVGNRDFHTFLLANDDGKEVVWSADTGHDGMAAVNRLLAAVKENKRRTGTKNVIAWSCGDRAKAWEHFYFKAADPAKPLPSDVDNITDLFGGGQ